MEFAKLSVDGCNYITWAPEVRIILGVEKLYATIGVGTSSAMVPMEDENDQAFQFLRHHLSPTLKDESMAMISAKALWKAMQERFERLKHTIKPLAEQEWERDHKRRKFRRLSAFHLNAAESTCNHHQSKYKKYSELIDVLQFHKVHDEEETSENVRAEIEIDSGKLKGLAPPLRNNEEASKSAPKRNYEEQDEEAPKSATYDEVAMNYVNSRES
ncbi:uncharacterized protein LOC133886385 [Phragmites australis]|uniref:uncharacterized protein LOC133886385 n=1 Tax=Phragmites australis TaxID=29695 RepID=UPI002D76C9A5|nr:uncharacterized protein LOC133886385 [Phragmites australis]